MSLTKVSYSMIQGAVANVLDYGADKTGVADSTAAVQAAVDTDLPVYFPKGTYLCNVEVDHRIVMFGDGSTSSILKPYDDTVAIVTYTYREYAWPYHSEIRNLGFYGTAKVGVGFTFGQTVPSDYAANDEHARLVHFIGCYFASLQKGIQFPFGNIGAEFYSCGFASNYYGVYTMNNKFGGVMHAGNKYFYAGEFSGNDCAFYLNDTAASFGGVTFHNTIIEGNKVGMYIYSSPKQYTPVVLQNVWFEQNGGTPYPGNTTIDVWSGTTVTPTTFANRTVIIDGDSAVVNIYDGITTDVYVKATNSQVNIFNGRVETATGVGGGPLTVDNTSFVNVTNPITDFGYESNNVITSGTYKSYRQAVTGTSINRSFIALPRSSKITGYGPSLVTTQPFTSAVTMTGSFNLTGTVVLDGRIYNNCNQFQRSAFGSGEELRLSTNSFTTSAGYYVFTFDVNVTQSYPVFKVWNSSTTQFMASFQVPELDRWYTVASIGYFSGASTQYLAVTGNDTDCTWKLSAWQVHRFDTEIEAQSFLMSGAYAAS